MSPPPYNNPKNPLIPTNPGSDNVLNNPNPTLKKYLTAIHIFICNHFGPMGGSFLPPTPTRTKGCDRTPFWIPLPARHAVFGPRVLSLPGYPNPPTALIPPCYPTRAPASLPGILRYSILSKCTPKQSSMRIPTSGGSRGAASFQGWKTAVANESLSLIDSRKDMDVEDPQKPGWMKEVRKLGSDAFLRLFLGGAKRDPPPEPWTLKVKQPNN